MGTTRDLGALGIIALALLDEQGAMHPYEMYQVLRGRHVDRVAKLSAGTLYHTIDRMARHGLVRVAGTEREGNRPERTAYEITPAGLAALKARVTEILETPVDEYPIFPIAIGEAHHLPAEIALPLLRNRIDQLLSTRDLLAQRIDDADARQVPRRFLLAAHYLLSQTDAELAWTRQLVGDIESGALDWSRLDSPSKAQQTIRTARSTED